ncbi:MAG: nickel pincer cofactor biosynthesis protein LarC [Acidobacteriaceae bacterium]
MKSGRIECFAGISGDMLLGALLDAGVSAELLQKAAASLSIGAELRVNSVARGGFRATKVDVLEHGKPAGSAAHHHPEHDGHRHDHEHGHAHGRNWPEIRRLIAAAAISEGAKRIAQRAFELLAEAEAHVHGIAPEEVHFHEVGAVDTITDIVCASVGLDSLGVDHWRCTPVNVGSGFVDCAHGRLPVPAPATAELLKGIPAYAAGPAMELTTPTGAAMLRALDCTFEPSTAPFDTNTIGYGAGGRNPEGFANVLRLSIGTEVDQQARAAFATDRVVVLECALDDATPQVVAHAMELALEHGALDAMAAPVTMKKGRLGTLVTVLCRSGDEAALETLLFRETTTLGIRRREEERVVLERKFVTVETPFGKIRMKIASGDGEILNAMPEYEDCRRAAREHDVPIRTVMEAAAAEYAAQQRSKAEA